MHEQLLLVFQHPIQTQVQPVFFRYRKILPQQNVHGAVIEPLPVQPKLAARIDQPIHHQQLQHQRPGYAFPPQRQLPRPEPIQLQLPPPLAPQPAVAIRPRSLQLHLAELHLQAVDCVGGNRPVLRKQTQRRKPVLFLIKYLQRFAPCCLLAVVDFPQVQHLPLRYFPRLQTPTFHYRVVAVFLPILDPRIAAQKHAPLQNARILPGCIEGRSPLQAFAKMSYSQRRAYLDDPPEFSAKLGPTAKVGLPWTCRAVTGEGANWERRRSPCAAGSLHLRIDDESRRETRSRRITPRARRRHITRTPGDLAEERLRLHVHLHLFEFEMPVVHQREYGARRSNALLHHVRRA